MPTAQDAVWTGDFGRDYTDRSPWSASEMDVLYENKYGVSRTLLNKEFLKLLDMNLRILEVGCNVGVQLQLLQQLRFGNLWGIELQSDAVRIARARTRHINFLQGSIHDLPFRDDYFDLVFTSGVLIHVPPDVLRNAIAEVHRCATRYIWGFEYHSPVPVAVPYRGKNDLLWKRDFAQLYLDEFDDLRLVAKRLVSYVEGDNEDCMFLLEKVD